LGWRVQHGRVVREVGDKAGAGRREDVLKGHWRVPEVLAATEEGHRICHAAEHRRRLEAVRLGVEKRHPVGVPAPLGNQGDHEPDRVVEICNDYFFEELQFKGNRQEYYDPRNSFLNEVLDRRVGIPITLAVVYVAVGDRAGLPLRGVGMPGHFLVKYAPASREVEVFIDAFNGRTLTRQECAKMLAEMYGETLEVRPSFFEPAGKRQILARILNTLKGRSM